MKHLCAKKLKFNNNIFAILMLTKKSSCGKPQEVYRPRYYVFSCHPALMGNRREMGYPIQTGGTLSSLGRGWSTTIQSQPGGGYPHQPGYPPPHQPDGVPQSGRMGYPHLGPGRVPPPPGGEQTDIPNYKYYLPSYFVRGGWKCGSTTQEESLQIYIRQSVH